MSLGAQDRQNYVLKAIITWAKHLLAKTSHFFFYNLFFMWEHWVNLQEMMKGNTLTGNSWYNFSNSSPSTHIPPIFPLGHLYLKVFSNHICKRGKQNNIKKYNMSGCSSWWVSCFSTTWNSSSFCSSTLCTMSHFINITHLLLTPSSLTSDALKFQSPGLYANLPQDALLQEYSVFIKQTLPQYFSKLFKKRGGGIAASARNLNWCKT